MPEPNCLRPKRRGIKPEEINPAYGVRRIVLERDGGEITTRATSLVAYRAQTGTGIYVKSGYLGEFALAPTAQPRNQRLP